MIKLWNEAPANDWKAIRKARKARLLVRLPLRTWLLELAGCLAIGLTLGYLYGRAW